MDDQQFDAFAKALAATRVTRRTVVTALVGVVAGGLRSVVRPVRSMASDGAPPGAPRSEQGNDDITCDDVLDPCGPANNPSCCDALRCEVCDVPSGQCRSRCRGGEACCDGDCRTDFTLVCDGVCCFQEGAICCGKHYCVSGQTDPENCGECGIRCAEDEICDRGRCRNRCDTSRCESYADGRCVVTCREEEICDRGACRECYRRCESFKDGQCVSACSADEVCDPERGCLPAEPIDPSICPTLLSDADLLELVPDGTDVTSLTSFDGEDDQGNIFVLCLWDVVGHPLPAEPWFDWLVSVQAAIKVRGDISVATWEEGLDAAEAGIGCAPATLPDDRTPVCLHDRPEAVDLTVRLDADRFLWLLLTSSKTGGAPDYPVLRDATERIAAFLIARLA